MNTQKALTRSSFRHCSQFTLLLLLLAPTVAAKEMALSGCTDIPNALIFWRDVRQNAADADAGSLVLPLAECLLSPNAELRDRIGYEVLTYWMRTKKLNVEQVAQLRSKLVPWLAIGTGESNEDSAFARAFSALVLSEVVRYDALATTMSSDQLSELLNAALLMFKSERDYRGLTDDFGWIHTIAHGADLLWRLAMHEKVVAVDQHRAILSALTAQITRSDLPAYTFNEFDRMARVGSAVIARNIVTPQEIEQWIEQLAAPGELENWDSAFSSISGMAQLHNQKHFLRALAASLNTQGKSAQAEKVMQASSALP